MIVLTYFDGTVHAKTALQYGIKTVMEKGGELVVLHVFHSALFVDYEGGPGAGETARREADRFRRDAEELVRLAGPGLSVRMLFEEGEPEQEILHAARTGRADVVLVPARYRSVAKKAPCPVVSIPGTILVPVDDTSAQAVNAAVSSAEALATTSKVLLLGVLPVHVYGKEERQELERVRQETEAQVKRLEQMLKQEGVEATTLMRAGYPDDEIMKASREFSASLVVLPTGGSTPSELRKAAEVLFDEQSRSNMGLVLVPAL
jgi:nucleotide-binding universal stress UspA family protein